MVARMFVEAVFCRRWFTRMACAGI